MRFQIVLLSFCFVSMTPILRAQTPSNEAPAPTLAAAVPVQTPIANLPIQAPVLEYLDYQQRVLSSSENIQLGEHTKLDMAYQYRFNQDTALRFRMDIDPNKNSEDNKTSKFELRLYHHVDLLEFQADFDLNGDDNGRGATTLGPDTDSKDSWIALNPSSGLRLIFYPYNIGTEIGREFRTLDVARINYIDGTPAFISKLPIEDESIRSKTIPGFELQFKPLDHLKFYLGGGSVGFYYPATGDFDIEQSASAERWKVKEDRAYKAGFNFVGADTNITAEFAKHTNAGLGGSLLEAAWSLQLSQVFGPLVLDLERTWTKAGTRAYRLNSKQNWFETTTPFRPFYSDYYGERQDWLGKTDAANMLRLGYTLGQLTPFIAYKYLGQYFIDREFESAQRLRSADESVSHGGLKVFALGANYLAGKFNFRPELDLLRANNPVFGNRNDVREDRILSELSTKDTQFKFSVSYTY